MNEQKLDKLISEALEIEDRGFTERVLNSLPAERQPFMKKSQLLIWATAFTTVCTIMFVASQYSAIAIGNSPASVAVTLVAFAVFVAHADDFLKT